MLGPIATTLTVSSIIPQLVKTYKTKQVDHLSLLQMLALYVGIICWLAYGISLGNRVIITANCISVFLQSLMIGMKIKYGKAKNGEPVVRTWRG